MSNDEIRAKILRLHYDLEMKDPLARFDTDTLKEIFSDIPENLLDANLVYLYESGLLEGHMVIGRRTPIMTRITPQGTNVVENPQLATKYQINVQVLKIGTVYGQVAQAAQGSTVVQTQNMTFDSLREMVRSRTDISDEEKDTVKKILDTLEKVAQEGSLTRKAIDAATKALADYGWLIPSLMEVLKRAFGFP